MQVIAAHLKHKQSQREHSTQHVETNRDGDILALKLHKKTLSILEVVLIHRMKR